MKLSPSLDSVGVKVFTKQGVDLKHTLSSTSSGTLVLNTSCISRMQETKPDNKILA